MRSRLSVAAMTIAVLSLSGCSGGSPLTPTGGSEAPEPEVTPAAEACLQEDRELLVPPFDTEGDCWRVPNVMAAAGNVGIGFDDPWRAEVGHFVDLTTGATRDFELPENAREMQALVAPVDGAPMFLVTGHEYREGDAFHADCLAPFALGFDLNGSSNPAYEAVGECWDPSDDRRITVSHVWAPPALLDIAAQSWSEIEFDDFPREVGPYTRIMSRPDPVAVFDGNLVQAVSAAAFKNDTYLAVRGLFAIAPDGSIVWTSLTEHEDVATQATEMVVGFLGSLVLVLDGDGTGPGSVTWYDGSTGETVTPTPEELAGLRGGVPGFLRQTPLTATADGRFVVLATDDAVVVIDVEAGTAEQIESQNSLTFTAVDGGIVYLISKNTGHSATYDLASGEATTFPDETRVPYLLTDRAVLFGEPDYGTEVILVTR